MTVRRYQDLAAELGIPESALSPRGHDVAKVDPALADAPPRGKLVLVSAITPTPAGEGKTTVSVGLGMGLRLAGTKTAVCVREPSLGPVFGIKGGGTGGGRATVHPEDRINLHFTGDIHAITAAHNLIAALIDNDLHFGASSGLSHRSITFPRVLDMNDRSLRNVIVGGAGEGVLRETRFDITAASEVMAILCLARSADDLRARLGRIVLGKKSDGSFVHADDLGATNAASALLTEAIWPNLAQTSEGGPAFVHGGPFANIAHGCSSVLATRTALAHADVVVTEAGFGFDLGGEKFLHLKCRSADLWPDLVVMVATLKALRMHGGVAVADASKPNLDALERGLLNLDAHLDNAQKRFGLRAVVAINHHAGDPEDELARVKKYCADRGVGCAPIEAFARGGEGALELAGVVNEALRHEKSAPKFLYELDEPIAKKIERVATEIYGADGVDIDPGALKAIDQIERAGFAKLPVCLAKTHRSLSDDAARYGRPKGFSVRVREARLSAGAGFVVALLGDVMTMPGLPKRPAAYDVKVMPDGSITGLMRSAPKPA
jgi:formate--tetrahydrofolate ligase